VIRDAQGNLYGTTSGGGASGAGTVYKLSTAGDETVLYSFKGGTDGVSPYAGVIPDAEGNLYGTTFFGGEPNCPVPAPFGTGCGTVFKLDKTGEETVLYRFRGGADGAGPVGGVILDAKGNLYGTTWNTNPNSTSDGCGTVFKVSQTGEKTLLYNFSCGADGAGPAAGVIRDAQGNLYGTTTGGGAYGAGTVYKLSAAGKETVLYSFAGRADGASPQSVLTRDAEGNFYGTAYGGGVIDVYTSCESVGCGVVFKLDRTGNESVLYTFTGGADGSNPYAGVIRDAGGNFYGTTYYGGESPLSGVVFKVDKTGKESVLHAFTGGADGSNPVAGVIQDAAGNLYGTTPYGGHYSCGQDGEGGGCGVVFKLTP
jgi:uncharacterized repeat protein (TIGR03803 family)